VLVAKDESDKYELVETHIFTRKDIDELGFSVKPSNDETVIAITVEQWEKEQV
jgi:hypothetical protein